jgi:hypothetical protein
MRTAEAFTLGAITGGIVAWFWGQEIAGYVRERTRGVRTQAAEGLQAVADGTGAVLDRGGATLRRAETFLEETKAQVDATIQQGQDALRPAPAGRDT